MKPSAALENLRYRARRLSLLQGVATRHEGSPENSQDLQDLQDWDRPQNPV